MTLPNESLPGLPAPDSDEKLPLTSTAGETETGWLHVEHFTARQPPRAIVVYCHGFSAYAAPFRHLADAMRRAGFGVTTFDMRGHGHSTGRRGYIRSFAVYRDDLAAVIAAARRQHGDVPFALVGHSQGGLVVLDYLLSGGTHPQPVCAVVATPMLRAIVLIARLTRPLVPLLAKIVPRLQSWNGISGDGATRNPDVRAAYSLDPLIHHVATPRWFNESMRTQRRVQADAKSLSIPTLMLTAAADKIVSNQAQTDFLRAAPAGMIEQKIYPERYHEIYLDPGRDEVIADTVGWLSGRML